MNPNLIIVKEEKYKNERGGYTYKGICRCRIHHIETEWIDYMYAPYCSKCLEEELHESMKNMRIDSAKACSIEELKSIIKEKTKANKVEKDE